VRTSSAMNSSVDRVPYKVCTSSAIFLFDIDKC
jgi:hypothetical protein